MRVAPGTSLDLFPEIYGDYPLSFDKAGERVTGPVDVVLSFVDDSGRQDSITLSLLVTPGDLPTTYTGGSGASLSCGPFPVTTGLGGH
jgi:hypothetical protein